MNTPDALPARSKRSGRIAARIAWRTARRHPGRSALIIALIALPTAGLAAGGVLMQSTMPTSDEELSYTLGASAAMISVISPPDPTLEQAPLEPYWTDRAVDDEMNPTGFDPDAGFRSPTEVLPGGTRILTVSESTGTIRTDTGAAGAAIVEGDAGDPALEGRYHLADGRAPRADDEVAVSAATLDRTGLRLGGSLRVTEPRIARLTVVGVIEDLQRGRDGAVIFVRDGVLSGVPAQQQPELATFYLPELSLDWAQVRALNADGMVVTSREVFEHPPAPEEYRVGKDRSWTDDLNSGYLSLILLLGGFAIFQVCLLAGAAFVVGMRADQRALATVASVGGEPRLISRIVSMGGVVLGAVGGLVGLALGTLAAWGFFAIADDGNAITLPGFHPGPVPLAGALLIAVLAGWIAALAAARAARRIDVVSALRGARRPHPARTRRAVAGAVVAIIGLVVLAGGGVLAVLSYWPSLNTTLIAVAMGVLAIGAIGLQLGLVLTTPALLSLVARTVSPLGEGARLASRDASRNHARSVPTVAAVMSTVFVAAFIMTFVSSSQASINRTYLNSAPPGTAMAQLVSGSPEQQGFPSDDQVDEVRALLTSTLGTDEIIVIDGVSDPAYYGQDPSAADPDGEQVGVRAHLADDCGSPEHPFTNESFDCPSFLSWSGGSDHLLVGDAATLEALLGHEPSAEAVRMLTQGGAVALYPNYLVDGEVTLDTWSDAQVARGESQPSMGGTPLRSQTVRAIYEDPGFLLAAGVVVSPQTADELGLDYGPVRALAATGTPLSYDQYDALYAGMSAAIPEAWANYEAGPPQYGESFAWALLGVSALIAFAAAAVAIGLARADARRDDEVLDAIGAPPTLRRSVAFWQAVVIAGIGTMLGAIVGTLPVLALALATWVGHATGVPDGTGPLTDFAPPWLQLGLVAVGVPLAIALGSWATAGRRRVAVRRVA